MWVRMGLYRENIALGIVLPRMESQMEKKTKSKLI